MNSKRQAKRKLSHVVQFRGFPFDVNVMFNPSNTQLKSAAPGMVCAPCQIHRLKILIPNSNLILNKTAICMM